MFGRPGRGLPGQAAAGPGGCPPPRGGGAARGPSASALRVAWRGGPRTAARRLPLRLWRRGNPEVPRAARRGGPTMVSSFLK